MRLAECPGMTRIDARGCRRAEEQEEWQKNPRREIDCVRPADDARPSLACQVELMRVKGK